jgi:hypothetical protein
MASLTDRNVIVFKEFRKLY